MRKLFAAILIATGCIRYAAAESFDIQPPGGLTVAILGGSTISGQPGWGQGWAMVSFSEPVNTPWFASCVMQRFYINLSTAGGKAMYQTLLLAKVLGKKVTRLLGNTADPNFSNVCETYWLQIEP
jgi:hypothetical protein